MEEVLQAIADLQENAAFTKNFIKEAEKLKVRADAEIAKTRLQLDRVTSPEASQIAYDTVLSKTLELAPDFTTDQIEAALAKSEEYSYLSFAAPLLDVAKDKNLYQIYTQGTGWTRNIIVRLDMDTVAGTIEDYADAVDEARIEMDVDEDRNPVRASTIWRTKIWPTRGGRGAYSHVVNLRLILGRSPAPFWSLLNYGNKNVKMSSDIGGTPYPSSEGTHFVEEAEGSIKKYFTDLFSIYRDNNIATIEYLTTAISDYQKGIEALEDLVKQMTENLPEAKVVASHLRVHTIQEIDPIKLQRVREKVERGEILPGQRLNIGVRGTRVRIRPSSLYPD